MESQAPVKVVAFDAGLTLLSPQPSALHVVAGGLRRAGVDVADEDLEQWGEAFHRVWAHHDEAWREAGEPDPHIGDPEAERRFWARLYRRVLEEMGVHGDHRTIADRIHDGFSDPYSWGPFPEVYEVLDAIRAAGLRTALLSNWNPQLRDILDAHDLTARFDAIVVSGEVGVTKPDPGIFHHLLDALGEPPGPQVAYVGDDVTHDVEPARELGLQAVLVDRAGRRPHHDGPRVSDLRELPDVLPLARPIELRR